MGHYPTPPIATKNPGGQQDEKHFVVHHVHVEHYQRHVYEILVSAQGPLVLGFGVLGLRVWGQGLTIFTLRQCPSTYRSTILAGLWGGANYENLTMASLVRSKLLGVQPNLYKFYDQRILHGRVWPVIRS